MFKKLNRTFKSTEVQNWFIFIGFKIKDNFFSLKDILLSLHEAICCINLSGLEDLKFVHIQAILGACIQTIVTDEYLGIFDRYVILVIFLFIITNI